MRDDRERLLDIAEAADRIGKYAHVGRAAFDRDELIQTWVIHHLQIIGEAARGISAEFRDRHPQVPWDAIIGMRHVLVHHYFGIDLDAVWSAVERDIPQLQRQVASLLAESGGPG